MPLTHVFNDVENRNTGVPMSGITVKAFDMASDTLLPIYADSSMTPLVPESTCTTDADGMYRFYIDTSAVYRLRFYAGSTLLSTVDNAQNVGPVGPSGPANSTYTTTADLEGADVTNASAILAEAGKAGTLTIRDYADFVAEVAADTGKVNYIRSTVTPAKVWVRTSILTDGAERVGSASGNSVQVELTARPTSATLAAEGGAALIGTTGPSNAQADIDARPTSADLAGDTGAALVGIKRNALGTTTKTIEQILLQTVFIVEFGAAFDVSTAANIGAATDDTAAWQAALAYLVTVGGGTLVLPPGASKTTAVIDIPVSVPIRITGSGMRKVYPGVFTVGTECPSTVVPYHTGQSAFRFLASSDGQGGFCGENFNVATLEDATQPNSCFGFETQGAFLYGFTFRQIGIHGFKKSGSGYPFELYFSGGSERAVGAVVINNCTINRNNWIVKTQSTCQFNGFYFTNNKAGQNGFTTGLGGLDISGHNIVIENNILESNRDAVKLSGAYQSVIVKNNYFEANVGTACIQISDALSYEVGPNNYHLVTTTVKVLLSFTGMGICLDAFWAQGPNKPNVPLIGTQAQNNRNTSIPTDPAITDNLGFYQFDGPGGLDVFQKPDLLASVTTRVSSIVRDQNPFSGEPMPMQEYTTTGTGIVSMTQTIAGSSGEWVVASILFKRTPDGGTAGQNPFLTLNVNNTAGSGTRDMPGFNWHRYWRDGEFCLLTGAIHLNTAMTSLGVYFYPHGVSPTAGRVTRYLRPFVYTVSDINKARPALDHFTMQSVTAAPTTGTWVTGDMLIRSAGGFYCCTAGGSPGTWLTLTPA